MPSLSIGEAVRIRAMVSPATASASGANDTHSTVFQPGEVTRLPEENDLQTTVSSYGGLAMNPTVSAPVRSCVARNLSKSIPFTHFIVIVRLLIITKNADATFDLSTLRSAPGVDRSVYFLFYALNENITRGIDVLLKIETDLLRGEKTNMEEEAEKTRQEDFIW
jgi:hypothetical protein